MLFADRHNWPDFIDLIAIALIAGTILAVIVTGHTLMVLDFRRYLRALRRGLIVVANYLPHIPAWAREQTPKCLVTLGLRLPCTEDDVMRSYRKCVKRLHPDRGGDQRRFLLLQTDFEQALYIPARATPRPQAVIFHKRIRFEDIWGSIHKRLASFGLRSRKKRRTDSLDNDQLYDDINHQ